jgi:DNA repair protein RecN (Recombination protein N)
MATEVATLNKDLSDSLDLIENVSRTLTALFDKQEASPEELDRLMQRKYTLQDLIKKYSADGTLQSVVDKRTALEEQLNNFENSDELLHKLGVALDTSYALAKGCADKLLAARQEAAAKIGEEVAAILAEMELPNSRFVTKFVSKDTLDAQGGVEAKFYLSVNIGFEPAPLAQVASGGEISRVMLALKEVFSDVDGTSTLLFDEIDTGISGRTAKKVAHKLHNLAKKKQVIVITHLPVVAAMGDNHFHIAKKVDNDRTKTDIRYLSSDERQKIIASMIAGEVTESSLAQAIELLKKG